MTELPLENVALLLRALEQEGRSPRVISFTQYRRASHVAEQADLDDVREILGDYVVLQDETYKRWAGACDVRSCENPALFFDGVHHLCVDHNEGGEDD